MARVESVYRPVRVEKLRPGYGLVYRPEGEITAISETALGFSNGEVVPAIQLMRKVAFRRFGQTWGESLFVAEDRVGLPSVHQVVADIVIAATEETDYWRLRLVHETARRVILRPYDLMLYVSMMADIGGTEAIPLFISEVAMKSGVPVKLGDENKVAGFYKSIAGLSYWEIEPMKLVSQMLNCYMAWQRGLQAYNGAPADYREALGEVLTDSRTRLRELAKVMIARGIVKKGQVIEVDRMQIDYGEILALLD